VTGADLKRLRMERGLTLEEWGRFLGYTGKNVRRQMYRYESGERKELPPRLILKLMALSASGTPRGRAKRHGG
jgi:transcriptional regulator with XRE-family HTH domain